MDYYLIKMIKLEKIINQLIYMEFNIYKHSTHISIEHNENKEKFNKLIGKNKAKFISKMINDKSHVVNSKAIDEAKINFNKRRETLIKDYKLEAESIYNLVMAGNNYGIKQEITDIWESISQDSIKVCCKDLIIDNSDWLEMDEWLDNSANILYKQF